jgi:ParB family chromosome partitioning protein
MSYRKSNSKKPVAEWEREIVPAPIFHRKEKEQIKKPHVARNTGNHEWYTPPAYVEAVRQVFGVIDLDPASSLIAQQTVQASTYYTKETDGLRQHWHGKIYLNPPYQAKTIVDFIAKLIHHYDEKDVTEAIVLVNNATETEWFYSVASRAASICFPAKRVRFLDPDGQPGKPLQGQAIIYLGSQEQKFAIAFSDFGLIFRQ